MNAVPLSRFRGAVLSLYQPPIRARATFYKMRRALDTLSELDGIETTADLTTETFARWVASRAGANPNSTISLLRALRAATRYALEEGWIDRPPSFRRLWPRKAPTRRRPLSHAEVSSLLAHLDRRRNRSWHDRRLHAVASLVAYTGLRASEALFMQVLVRRAVFHRIQRPDEACRGIRRLALGELTIAIGVGHFKNPARKQSP